MEENILEKVKRIEINAENPSVNIAVYGSLRKNLSNSYLLRDSEFLGQFLSDEEFTMYSHGGFPTLSTKETEDSTQIVYELYRVTKADVLEDLHSLEGFTGYPGDEHNWYDCISLTTPHGSAYIYAQHEKFDLPTVISGDWKNRN